MPEQIQPPHVLLHGGCHLSDELPELLRQAVPGMNIVVMGDPGTQLKSAVNESGVAALLVVAHDGCFKDEEVVASLRFALESKLRVCLLHEADSEHRGCVFGDSPMDFAILWVSFFFR